MKKVMLIMLLLPVFFGLDAQQKSFTTVLDGFRFTEGPAVDASGNLYFTDIPENKIYIYTPEEELSVYLDNTGGANGLFFDHSGNLVACAGGDRQVVRYDINKRKTVLLDQFEGKALNSPNDLWIDPRGGIYFTDPRYGNTDNMEMEIMGVYYFHPADGKVVRVIDNMVRPNGIIGSHDGKKLYVVDEGANQFIGFDIKKPGKLANRAKLMDEGGDGVSIDDEGRIYVTVRRAVVRYDPKDGSTERYPMEV